LVLGVRREIKAQQASKDPRVNQDLPMSSDKEVTPDQLDRMVSVDLQGQRASQEIQVRADQKVRSVCQAVQAAKGQLVLRVPPASVAMLALVVLKEKSAFKDRQESVVRGDKLATLDPQV